MRLPRLNNSINNMLRYLIAVLILSYLCSPIPTHATTPLSGKNDILWSHPSDTLHPADIAQFRDLNIRRDLDNYIGRLEMICDFLDSMQEHDEDNEDYGGMHEGEDRYWNIIQTDNTQEAIRAWCEYAAYYDDTETFSANIDEAWIYCENYPAWEEENSQNNYYRIHNSGWGLIAEMRYSELYNDDYSEYGTSCADYIINSTPDIDVDGEDLLIPLVAGWASGALYLYGEQKDNDDYIAAAVEIAAEVQDWLEHDTDRFFSNEIWAMCGGTAAWGVITALGRDDSTTTATWIDDYLENMDVFAGRGDWNNSWNIWYAHAWIAAWQLTGGIEYRNNAITIVDSLLSQDGDFDGGIPATGGEGDGFDQSWVTAYTGWMGLSNLFSELPEIDVRLLSLLEPSTNRPWPIGSSLPISIAIDNLGYSESVNVPLTISGTLDFDTTVILTGWEIDSVSIFDGWIPEFTGVNSFQVYSHHEDDNDNSSDTLRFSVNVLPTAEINISTSAFNEPYSCQVIFEYIDVDSQFVAYSFITSEDGELSENMMVGTYNVTVIPEFPFNSVEYLDFNILPDEINLLDVAFAQPSILLVDNDTETEHHIYYTESLNSLGYTFYHWRSQEMGSILGKSNGFPTLIYFTGDRSENTVPANDQREIRTHVNRGHDLFVTGQHIADDLAESSFIESILHSQHLADVMRPGEVMGVDSDEVMDGMHLLLFGGAGAANQNAKSGITPTNDGVSCATYRDVSDTSAAIRWSSDNGSQGVFFAFGFEGISGQAHTTQRETVMESALNWFETPQSVADPFNSVSTPAEIILTTYPNPANSGTHISCNLNGYRNLNIDIVDISGRIVRSLRLNDQQIAYWDGKDELGISVSTGLYIIRAKLPNKKSFIHAKLAILR